MNRYTALRIAIEVHAGQTDKSDTEPYINHVLAVAEKAAFFGEVHEVVAILHDVVEDTEIELSELEDDWGLDALQSAGVDAMTQREGEEYFTYIMRCIENPFAFIVKMADISHNLSPERQDVLPEQTRKSLEGRYKKAIKMISETPQFEFVKLHNSDRDELAWYRDLVKRCCG
jgi:(p)ppGpp synthase/HD superfamily hydrolase